MNINNTRQILIKNIGKRANRLNNIRDSAYYSYVYWQLKLDVSISACKIIFPSFSITCRINIFLFFFFHISPRLCQSVKITSCNAIYDIIGANNRKFPVLRASGCCVSPVGKRLVAAKWISRQHCYALDPPSEHNTRVRHPSFRALPIRETKTEKCLCSISSSDFSCVSH